MVFLSDITRPPGSTLSRSFRQSNRKGLKRGEKGLMSLEFGGHGVRAFWNFQRQGEVKMFMLHVARHGHFPKLTKMANC